MIINYRSFFLSFFLDRGVGEEEGGREIAQSLRKDLWTTFLHTLAKVSMLHTVKNF